MKKESKKTSYEIEERREDALKAFLEEEGETIEEGEITTIDNKRHLLSYASSEEYLVLTELEAEEAWAESLESYIDELLTLAPEFIRSYVDTDKLEYDLRFDGRGPYLATYDGEEYESYVDGELFLIYRQ